MLLHAFGPSKITMKMPPPQQPLRDQHKQEESHGVAMTLVCLKVKRFVKKRGLGPILW